MHFFKRIELWILLAVILAGLAWVFLSGRSADDDSRAEDGAGAQVAAPLRLHRCVLKREDSHARLDIDLRVQNNSPKTLVMREPEVKLLGGKGHEIPSFFLAFDPVPEVQPGSTQDVQLRYWLESADLKGPLTLDVNGKTLTVKSAKPFDLTPIRNEEERVIEPGKW